MGRSHVIMLTAKGQSTDRAQGLGIGADDFITKPFSTLDVLARVKNILG
jgi:DNA-binding response OmpR family regulator